MKNRELYSRVVDYYIFEYTLNVLGTVIRKVQMQRDQPTVIVCLCEKRKWKFCVVNISKPLVPNPN